MTVCIAAAALANHDPLIVLCMDLKGSTEYTSAETTSKWRPLRHGFYALLSGPVSATRELASACHAALGDHPPASMAHVMKRLRHGVGLFKKKFADEYTYKHLGISYENFRKSGKASLPDDLFHQITAEIKEYFPADVELIAAGFLRRNPVIFKVSSGQVWSCDDFAVIGSGTLLGEAALYNREQHFMYGLNRTLYNTFEAKRLAERAEGVGRKTSMFVVRPQQPYLTSITIEGVKILDEYFQMFGPQSVQMVEFPESAFQPVALESELKTIAGP